ncbi:MAG: tRNA threonylcarbamoyladenosine dehydratase [Oscillospiraceae bacterium]|jgi:tRNA A37 threonylcarbamoyladenosine dehydratase|nr:tRNA threonylcarbamoyladenosine dehydratase [Oscillospiraceae bacterium]
MDWLDRTRLLLGETAIGKLLRLRVAVFGAGGVGGSAVEALARGGVGALDIFDGDAVAESNLNRQIIATVDAVGRRKAVVAKDRVLKINPNCAVNAADIFITAENINEVDFSAYDYVIDAIDTVSSKLAIIAACGKKNTPLVSSMGAGNKLDPTRFKISDIYETSVCPLARVMRKELKSRGIDGLTVLWSDEPPVTNSRPPGSVSFVPPVAGLIIAGHVIRAVTGSQSKPEIKDMICHR